MKHKRQIALRNKMIMRVMHNEREGEMMEGGRERKGERDRNLAR